MTVYDRAVRIHDMVVALTHMIGSPTLVEMLNVIDVDIHEVISDYERRGMGSDGPSS